MAIADASGIPVAAHIESASPHEVKLVGDTIDSGFTLYAPELFVLHLQLDLVNAKLMDQGHLVFGRHFRKIFMVIGRIFQSLFGKLPQFQSVR